MAKKSMIARDRKRMKLVAKYAEKRAAIKERINDPEATPEERPEAFRAVQMLEAENAYPYSGTVYTNTGHIYRNDVLSNADHSWYLTGDKRVLYLSLTPSD